MPGGVCHCSPVPARKWHQRIMVVRAGACAPLPGTPALAGLGHAASEQGRLSWAGAAESHRDRATSKSKSSWAPGTLLAHGTDNTRAKAQRGQWLAGVTQGWNSRILSGPHSTGSPEQTREHSRINFPSSSHEDLGSHPSFRTCLRGQRQPSRYGDTSAKGEPGLRASCPPVSPRPT